MVFGVTGPVAIRSAPCTSLPSTLPLRMSWLSEATPPGLSSKAFGTSSTTLTSNVPVAPLLLLSVAVTVNDSLMLLVPAPVGWLSVPLRV
ncbi:hypothetical protein PS834_05604 [Pseudomonas fluorescens]|nr:hypothetical protein PS834_05604 [Pseudomonas fluorescens]